MDIQKIVEASVKAVNFGYYIHKHQMHSGVSPITFPPRFLEID